MRLIRRKNASVSSPLLITGSVSVLILTGTLLLKLPIATDQPISGTNAFFTEDSAATVTGSIL